jgi:flagellar hook protein FlgE
MSLYGALFSGVSGLRAQSTKIGVISDNISNTNTVGYKAGQGVFQSLVTGSGGTTAFSPGGVLGGNRQLISKQGLLQATDSPTDIAISGDGFFVVNKTSDGTGQVLFTRAGSFTQDSTGNFRNSAGFFLQAWPLDREGRLPGEPGNVNTSSSANLSSLRTVNVQNLTGTAAATTSVSLGANLNAGQVAFAGAAGLVTMDPTDSNNFGIGARSMMIPSGDLVRDATTLNIDIGGVDYDFVYGGFSFSRSVSLGTGGDDGSGDLGNGETTLANDPIATNSTNVVTITNAGHGLSTGDVVELSGIAGPIDGIPASELNARHVITVLDANTYTITVATTATGTTAAAGGAAVVEDARLFDDAGNILDAATPSQTFLGTSGTSNFTATALSFAIATDTVSATFTYTASSPNAGDGEFNTLNNLADAINEVDGLTARVVGNQLYIGAIDAREGVTFTNGSTTGSEGPPVQAGIDWVGELGLVNVSPASTERFSTMEGLAALVNASDGLSATVEDPLSESTLSLFSEDPLGTITFSSSGGGDALTALGLPAAAQGPSYDPGVSATNMASGAITPHFSRPIRIFDALGGGHDISVQFLNIGVNSWAVEIVAVPETDVNATDGQLASGTIEFNGDGTLRSIDSELTDAIDIDWTSGSSASSITLDWGTAGLTDGLSQFNSSYSVNFVNQNGAPVGALIGVSIDEEGFITASYNNGESQRLYKIPLAGFPNPNQLSTLTGNVFAQSSESGEVNLRSAGNNGVGKIASASLEASNVELADQLTDMIVAQRAYQANTKVISTADSLLDDLNRILQ